MNENELKALFSSLFERYAGATTREGTAIVDEIINPLVLLHEPIHAKVKEFLALAAAPSEAPSTELARLVGRRWGVEPVAGGRAKTSVGLVFTAPASVDIPAGSAFMTQSRLRFVTERRYAFSPDQFTEREDGLYQTPDVNVVADAEGAAYNVAAGEVTVIAAPPKNALFCINGSAATGGAASETDAEFALRLQDVLTSRALDTQRGVVAAIADRFAGEVSRVSVVTGERVERAREPRILRHREVPLDLSAQITP